MCGGISGYNATEPVPGPANLMNIVTMRARMEGFIILDYMPRAGEAIADLLQWIGSGELKYQVDLQQGFDNIPDTLQSACSRGLIWASNFSANCRTVLNKLRTPDQSPDIESVMTSEASSNDIRIATQSGGLYAGFNVWVAHMPKVIIFALIAGLPCHQVRQVNSC